MRYTRRSGWSCPSHASSALSTASLIVVIRDRCSESNPSICLFFSKNSAMLIDFCFSASFSAMGGAGVCGIGSLLIYLAGIVDICIGRATRLSQLVVLKGQIMGRVLYELSSDVSCMEPGKLRRDQHAVALSAGHIRSAKRPRNSGEASTGAAEPNAKKRCTGSVLKRRPHNSKSQQKEARTGRYIEKQASNFAKYLIMEQTLKCGVW